MVDTLVTADRIVPIRGHHECGISSLGVNAPAGSFYAFEPARHLGLGAAGAVRAGLAPYTDQSDVDRLIAAVESLDAASAD